MYHLCTTGSMYQQYVVCCVAVQMVVHTLLERVYHHVCTTYSMYYKEYIVYVCYQYCMQYYIPSWRGYVLRIHHCSMQCSTVQYAIRYCIWYYIPLLEGVPPCMHTESMCRHVVRCSTSCGCMDIMLSWPVDAHIVMILALRSMLCNVRVHQHACTCTYIPSHPTLMGTGEHMYMYYQQYIPPVCSMPYWLQLPPDGHTTSER